MVGKVNYQDRVLGNKSDQHDDTKDCEDTECLSRKCKCNERSNHGKRNRKQHDERIHEVVVQCHHDQVHKEYRSKKRKSQLRERLFLVFLVSAKYHRNTCRLIHTVEDFLNFSSDCSGRTSQQLRVDRHRRNPVVAFQARRSRTLTYFCKLIQTNLLTEFVHESKRTDIVNTFPVKFVKTDVDIILIFTLTILCIGVTAESKLHGRTNRLEIETKFGHLATVCCYHNLRATTFHG